MNAAGAVQTTYGYDPYGVTSTTGTASDSPYQYAGRENDGTGLYYNRARYYNPAWGRFVSEDPIGLRGGINRYAYAGGNPVSRRDPSGKFLDTSAAVAAGRAGVGALIGAAAGVLAGVLYPSSMGDGSCGGSCSSPATDPDPAAGGGGDGGKTPPAAPTPPSGGGGNGGGDGGSGDGGNPEPPNVRFGNNDNQTNHTFRHTDDLGLSREAVGDAVRTDVQSQATTAPAQNYTGNVNVDGINLEYRGFTLPDGTINVGRITGPR